MESLESTCRQSAERCAWTLLGSVGMSSASGERARHSVSPEDALVIASIASATDRRLRDEARDWFIAFDDLVSRPALKHRVTKVDPALGHAWSSFAAPLQGQVRGSVPGIDVIDGAESFRRSGKTHRNISADVPYGVLRCRAAFGTQARADVLFLLATTPDNVRGWMADALARSAGYAKSAVRDSLDRLTEAGVTRRTRVGNADWFALADPSRVTALIGSVVAAPVDTSGIPRVLQAMIRASHVLDADDDPAAFVTARSTFEPVERELGDLRAQLPHPTHEFDRGRAELVDMITALAGRISDPSRALWPW